MTLDELTADTFQAHLNDVFQMRADGQVIDVTLISIDRLRAEPGMTRPPFSLVFRGPCAPAWPQQICELFHANLGEFDIFSYPSGLITSGCDTKPSLDSPRPNCVDCCRLLLETGAHCSLGSWLRVRSRSTASSRGVDNVEVKADGNPYASPISASRSGPTWASRKAISSVLRCRLPSAPAAHQGRVRW